MRIRTGDFTAPTITGAKPTSPLRQIIGHVSLTQSMGTAWYKLAPVSWSFRPDRDRENHMANQAIVMAQLTGKRLRIRGTTTPFPVKAWAEQLHQNVVEAGRPFGAMPLPAWPDFLAGEQKLFLDSHQAEKETYFGVDFLHRGMGPQLWSSLMDIFAPSKVRPMTEDLRRQANPLQALDTLMSRAGMNGRPLTSPEMAWLLHRSSHLGFPAPPRRVEVDVDQWSTGDLSDLLDTVSWAAEPFASTMTVTGQFQGRTIVRHVAILTVGRMQQMEIPQRDQPWMTIPDGLGFPLEWSAQVTPRADKVVLAEVRQVLSKINAQTRHYEDEHGLDAPAALEDQRALALQVERELTNLADTSLGRARGWWRIAVSGTTRAECLSRVERVVGAFGRKVEIVHGYGQHAKALEFIPGTSVTQTAHARNLPLRAVAAGGAAVTSMAGDRRGWNIGRSGLDNSPVMFNFWKNMEDYDVSGLYPVLSALGGGKSNFIGGVVGETALAGIRWCCVDPAGRMGKLGRTPQLRAVSAVVDLLNGDPGSMNPYRMVPEPKLTDFDFIDFTELGDKEMAFLGLRDEDLDTVRASDLDPAKVEAVRQKRFQQARRRAMAIRTRLAQDSLLQILPATFAVSGEHAGEVATELRLAAMAIIDPAGEFKDRPKHPGLIIEALRQSKTRSSSIAQSTADLLDSIRHDPQPSLLFPLSDDDDVDDAFNSQLVFLSTKGIVLPDPETATKPEHWGDESRQGVAILNLASWRALRWVYALSPNERKGLALDELGFLNKLPSGQLLSTEGSRNSRKNNLVILAAGQDPGDTLVNDRGANFIGGAFLGRMDDLDAASRALRLIQVPVGVGYENTLMDMPRPTDENPDVPRQFLFYNRGGAGFREVITVNREGSHTDWLWSALESAPRQEYAGAVR